MRKLVQNARTLRNNLTKEERKLWYEFLCNYRFRVMRQRAIGNYVVDFYCAKAKVVIELDGGQHYTETAKVYDKKRTDFLNGEGILVIRYTNLDILAEFKAVCESIDLAILKRINE